MATDAEITDLVKNLRLTLEIYDVPNAGYVRAAIGVLGDIERLRGALRFARERIVNDGHAMATISKAFEGGDPKHPLVVARRNQALVDAAAFKIIDDARGTSVRAN